MTTNHSDLARASRQQEFGFNLLPYYPLKKNAQARNAYGSAAQHLVCTALRLRPIPINGSKRVCFDAEDDFQFYEIKSVRKGGKIVLYDWRMEKERLAFVPLSYAILVHQNKPVKNSEKMWEQMATQPLHLLQCSHQLIHTIASLQPLRKLVKDGGPRCGYSRHGYKEGYRNVPLQTLYPFLVCVCLTVFNFGPYTFKAYQYKERVGSISEIVDTVCGMKKLGIK